MFTVWTVPATVLSVVDGDTFHLSLDLGWHFTYRARVRIAHVNAPELRTPEGVAAKQFAETLVKVGDGVVFVSHSLDKYGRPLGDLKLGPSLAALDYAIALMSAGHAVKMN